MNRAERLQRRYEQIYNDTGDSKLANRLKHNSNQTIYETIGVKIDLSSRPKVKREWTKTAKKRAETRREKFTMARELGFDVEESKYVSRYAKSRFETTKEYRKIKASGLASTQELKGLWKVWSGNNGAKMPIDIILRAQKINKSVKSMGRTLKKDSDYGYAYIYWEWVLNKTPEDIEKGMTPDVLAPYSIMYEEDNLKPVKGAKGGQRKL